MVGRARAVADGEAAADRLRHVRLRERDRVAQSPPARQVRGDGRGVGAAGAVGVRRVNPLAGDDASAATGHEDVGRPPLAQVAALDQHGARAVVEQPASRLLGVAQ